MYYINTYINDLSLDIRSDIRKNKEDVSNYNVFIPKAYGAGENYPHQILGLPEYGGKDSVCSQTYLYASFDSEEEAKNFISYLKTRFFRMLVSAIKITHDALSGVYQFVPKLDFTQVWTDEKLYTKFNINPEEQNYIKSIIKEMV